MKENHTRAFTALHTWSLTHLFLSPQDLGRVVTSGASRAAVAPDKGHLLGWSGRATAAVAVVAAGQSAARLCTNTTARPTPARCRRDPPRPGIWAETPRTPTLWAPWGWRLTWWGRLEWTRSTWCSWSTMCGGLRTSCTIWRRLFIAKVRYGQAATVCDGDHVKMTTARLVLCADPSRVVVLASRCALTNLWQVLLEGNSYFQEMSGGTKSKICVPFPLTRPFM